MKYKKKTLVWVVVILVVLVGAGIYLAGNDSSRVSNMENEVVSRDGLHWHSTLKIYKGGELQAIPSDIGLGAVHKPVHTHETDGTIHLEFGGVVFKKDTQLGEFFKNWNKDIRSFGTLTRMTVGGVENTEYENYYMHDGDIIELYYE